MICPLNWGLGHATRCVQIIRELLESGDNVIIAADKAPLAFLKKEFPNMAFDVRNSEMTEEEAYKSARLLAKKEMMISLFISIIFR